MGSDRIWIGDWGWKYRVRVAGRKQKIDDLLSVVERYLFVHRIAVYQL